MLGKQKWISCSSQPTPREAKLIATERLSLFAEPKEKIILAPSLTLSRR